GNVDNALSGSECAHSCGLGPLGALTDGEDHSLAVFEAAETPSVDLAVVHEHVGASAIGGDETEALLTVEPLHGSFGHVVSFARDVGDHTVWSPAAAGPSKIDVSHLPRGDVTRPHRSFADVTEHEHATPATA